MQNANIRGSWVKGVQESSVLFLQLFWGKFKTFKTENYKHMLMLKSALGDSNIQPGQRRVISFSTCSALALHSR